MTLSLATDLSAIQGELAAWAEALRSIGKMVEEVERVQVDQTHSPPALVRMIADFEALRQLGRNWTNELRPALVATVPGGIEAYAASFDAHTRAALSALEGSDKALAQARVKQEMALLDAELAVHLGATKAVDAKLKQFMASLDKYVQAIEIDGKQAVNEVQLDEDRLARTLAELDQLIGTASSEKSRIDFLLTGQGTTGSGVVDVLLTINPAALLVRAGYAVWSFFGGSNPAEEQRRRIEDLRRQRDSMSNEQRRVAGLRLIHRQIAPLADGGRQAIRASGQIVNFWAVFQTKQESVVSAIARSSAGDIAPLVRVHLNTGAKAWAQLAAYARSLRTP
ncbi:MAG: hypothetical protein ACJ8ER_17545 [Allosphingosinicella sp.]